MEKSSQNPSPQQKKTTNLVGHHVGVQDAFDAILSHLDINRQHGARRFMMKNMKTRHARVSSRWYKTGQIVLSLLHLKIGLLMLTPSTQGFLKSSADTIQYCDELQL